MAQPSSDDAAKQRIISHMNADHHDSIVRYLEHYARLSSWTAYDGTMTGVDLQGMDFTCQGKVHRVPFSPPLKTLRETREKVVEMDCECLRALDKSEITITQFAPPLGALGLVSLLILATFVAYSRRSWFEQGGIVDSVFGSSVAKLNYAVQPWVITVMVGMHAAELVYFIRTRLRKHSVNVRTLVWWKWAGFALVEGFVAFIRFDSLVEQKREAKQKQKH